METRVTTLVENNPGEHKSLRTEHGLSFHIQHGESSLVFDTGQSDAFIHNASILNIDLSAVDHVVLSHGHYDHTNGLPAFVEKVGSGFALWGHRDLMTPKYATKGLSVTYLGPNFTTSWRAQQGFDYKTVSEDITEVTKGIFLVTNFEASFDLEVKNPRFVIPDARGELVVDDFHDEVAVVITTKKGLIVLVGCSHPGIMNMLSTIHSRFSEPILAVLGGTHLVEAQGKRLHQAVDYLTAGEFGKLGLSHCTGAEAMNELELQSSLFYRNTTGTSLVV